MVITKNHIRTIAASIMTLACVMFLTASRHKTDDKTLYGIKTPLTPAYDINDCIDAYVRAANAMETKNQPSAIGSKTEPKSDAGHKKLTAKMGINQGPTGKETWYDLDMSGVLYLMNHIGYTYEEYPYWFRDDGDKMFGDYVMVAADLDIFPKGTIVECSLGTAMVVDTGDLEPYQLDIAVDWK